MSRSSRITHLHPIPDGAEIARLRVTKRMSQETLAQDAQLSPRMLGDIERLDVPFPHHRLIDLANALGVPVERILKKESVTEPPSDPSGIPGAPTSGPQPASEVQQEQLLLLRLVTDALAFWKDARQCDDYEYELDAAPTLATAPLIEEMLCIIKRTVQGLAIDDLHNTADEFDREREFPEVYRMARLGQLLDEIRASGIALLANTYYHNTRNAGPHDPLVVRRLRVLFAREGSEKRLVEIDCGAKGVVWPSGRKVEEVDDLPF